MEFGVMVCIIAFLHYCISTTKEANNTPRDRKRIVTEYVTNENWAYLSMPTCCSFNMVLQ